MGNFQNGRLGRQLWMKTWTERQQHWQRKADEISVSYCFASDSAAAYNSSSEADSKVEGKRIPNVMVTELMLKKRSLIWCKLWPWEREMCWHENGSRLTWGSRTEKKRLANCEPHIAGPCALHTLHTLLLHHCRCPSICLSICHVGALCPDGRRYRETFLSSR